MKRRADRPATDHRSETEYDGDFGTVISTGSTLLDLAISGGRVRGGGLPGGILVEIFGPSGSGKTVMLCEIAGAIQRQGGAVMFHDPEARLNKQYARMFGLDTAEMEYTNPDTVPEVFQAVREWKPPPPGSCKGATPINGILTDSLAALSTDMEMEDGDKYGMRRAKEFSEELRKTCRILQKRNLLMVCSNQIRQDKDAGPYGQKYTAPGGMAIGFYSSLRLRCSSPKKIKRKKTIGKEEVTRVVGVETEIEVFKSSVDKPFRSAPVTILFDYGIDDIRQNLQFIKDHRGNSVYYAGETKLSNAMEDSIKTVEENGLEEILREDVTDLWEKIDKRFQSRRKPKR
jgi:recombination protein RecA